MKHEHAFEPVVRFDQMRLDMLSLAKRLRKIASDHDAEARMYRAQSGRYPGHARLADRFEKLAFEARSNARWYLKHLRATGDVNAR